MENSESSPAPGTSTEEELADLEQAKIQALSEQNFPLGILAGLAAACIGAAIWGALAYATGYQIGWLAIGIGCLVGGAVGRCGKGATTRFGVLGGVLALLSILLGNYLTIIAFVAPTLEKPFFSALQLVAPSLVFEILIEDFSARDIFFYAIAVCLGFSLGFRDVVSITARQRMRTRRLARQKARTARTGAGETEA